MIFFLGALRVKKQIRTGSDLLLNISLWLEVSH